MPDHHRLRFLIFPMRASRLCTLWPDMRPLRFRRAPFGRDGALRPRRSDGISHSDAAHIAFDGSERLGLRNILPFVAHPTPHPIAVYASHPPSPTTAQHSLPGSALPPYRGRSFTGRIASASPDAPELNVRIHSPPAVSQGFRIVIGGHLPSLVTSGCGTR